MNPMKLLQLKSAWEKFNGSHPKFTPFVKAVASTGLPVGTIITMKAELPDGRNYETNLKVCETDHELIETIKEMN